LKCKVCSREVETLNQSGYCELHQNAYQRLQEKFDVWKTASNIDWKNYLQEVVRNPLTGTWAKEVAQNLLLSEAP